MKGLEMAQTGRGGSEPASYNPEAVVELLGRKVHILELSPDMPAHPERRQNLPNSTIVFHTMTTPGVWVDLSFVPPGSRITLGDIKRGMEAASVHGIPEGATFMYWTGAENIRENPSKRADEYPGLDPEASDWILGRGVANVCTDAPGVDNPPDLSYRSHLIHGKRPIIHTELVVYMRRIPRHEGFYVIALPQKVEGVADSPIKMIALWEE